MDGRVVGRAVRPSAGVHADYHARLRRLVDEMARSVDYWLTAAYRQADDRIAALGMDARYIRNEDGPEPYGDAEFSSLASRVVEVVSPPWPPFGSFSGGGTEFGHTRSTVPPPTLRGGLDGVPCLADPSALPHSPGGRILDEGWRYGFESRSVRPHVAQLDRAPLPLALDARPSTTLDETIRRLRRRWLGRFRDASEDLARYFAKAAWRRSDAELKKILKRGGFSVEMKISQSARDVLAAIVRENVALIKSIPEQYLGQVEGSVMRSVVAGRDLRQLTEDLQHHHGVTRRRAESIALHQNNSATSAIQRVQYLDMGIERAIWRHSHAGKTPRPTHVANDGNEYDVRRGWYDPHERKHVRPGELVNCRCFNQPVMPR